ncbi:MAG: TonB-dependent receptor [Chitinophagaceae bacterium]
MKRIFLFFFAAFFIQHLSAQTGKISGTVSGPAVAEGIVVSLFKASDKSLAKTTLCEANGSFEFLQLKDNRYYLKISHSGYATYTSDTVDITNGSVVVLQHIVLQVAAKDLQEVKITGKKPFAERKIDRVVIHPDMLISNAGTSSLEVLEKAPGVLVDGNGTISLKGKSGVMVFIDDKPSYLSGADLANYLRSLPSGSIETIELITNPPARYDAAGNAGIINIRLKKNIVKGVNGGISLSYGQGRYHRTNNSFNINYRVNKINFFANLGWNQNHTYQDLTIKRSYYTPSGEFSSGFEQNSYLKREISGVNLRLGADYYINSRSTAGIVVSGFSNRIYSPIVSKGNVFDNTNTLAGRVAATNPSERKWKNGSVNLNYSYKIGKKGKEISANIDYNNYDAHITQKLVSSVYTADNHLINESTLESTLPASIIIKTAKVDYVHPLKQGAKLEAGLKTSFVNTDNTASFFDRVDNVVSPNYQFSNRFLYKENINAAYASYQRNWKKISLQAGLRLEHTVIDGNQLGNPVVKDSTFHLNYANLFPTVYLQFRADSLQKHVFGFSAGRRVNRPNYQDMNPFTYPLDLYTYYAGNPFLQPTFSYSFEVSHTFKNKITTSFDYTIVKNLIQETNEQRGTIFYSRPGNFGRQVVYGLDVNATLQPYKWWTLILYTEFKNMGYDATIYGQRLKEDRFYWVIAPTNQFNINKNLSAEIAGSYQTRILVAQFLTIPVWQVRAGISQKILKGKGSIRLNISDLFYTNQPGGDIRNIANAKANWLSYLDSRVGSFTFTYRFAKGKGLNARKSGGADDEKGRVKTN